MYGTQLMLKCNMIMNFILCHECLTVGHFLPYCMCWQ